MRTSFISKTEIKYMAVHVLAALICSHGSDDDTLVARSVAITSKLNDAIDALPDEKRDLERDLDTVRDLREIPDRWEPAQEKKPA